MVAARVAAAAARAAVVPLTYGREVWNTLQQGIDPSHEALPHHDSLLTADQARRVNEHFDIELYFGRHGFGMQHVAGDTLPSHILPTQLEYEEAARIIDGLQEGDTLLLEGRGFDRNPPDPITTRALLEAYEVMSRPVPESVHTTLAEAFRSIGYLAINMAAAAKYSASIENLANAQTLREGYLGDAWLYAHFLAAAKGVRIRYADYDKYLDDRAAERNGISRSEQVTSTDTSAQLQYLRDLRGREKVARNTAKDVALEDLPPEDTPPPRGRKPKLAVLYGAFHKDTMIQGFHDMNLDVTAHDMAQSSPEERMREHAWRDLTVVSGRMIVQALFEVSRLAGAQVGATPDVHPQATADGDRAMSSKGVRA
jgi:hypothetical protein